MLEDIMDSPAYWQGREAAIDSVGEVHTDPAALRAALVAAQGAQGAHPPGSADHDFHAGRASVYAELLER